MNHHLFLIPALAVVFTVACPSRAADDSSSTPELIDSAAELVVLKHAYNETRVSGFTKIHQAHLDELDRLLTQQLKSGDLAGANLINAEIELVKDRIDSLGKGKVIPVPDSAPPAKESPASLEKAKTDHRSILQKGVDLLNREYIAKISAIQKQFMNRADLQNANALEKWKVELNGESSDTAAAGSNTIPAPPSLNGIDLLAPERRERWVEDRGIWAFKETSLKGSGDSHIVYRESLRPPFTLAFDLKVEKGSRPRVYVGRHTIGNDGMNFQLILQPRDPKQKTFPYKNGDTVAVKLIVNRRFIELHVGGKLIDRREPGVDKAIDEIAFSGGDGWSPGITEFSNIRMGK